MWVRHCRFTNTEKVIVKSSVINPHLKLGTFSSAPSCHKTKLLYKISLSFNFRSHQDCFFRDHLGYFLAWWGLLLLLLLLLYNCCDMVVQMETFHSYSSILSMCVDFLCICFSQWLFYNLPKHISRWTGYFEWPLGVNAWMCVFMVPCNELVSKPGCVSSLHSVFPC